MFTAIISLPLSAVTVPSWPRTSRQDIPTSFTQAPCVLATSMLPSLLPAMLRWLAWAGTASAGTWTLQAGRLNASAAYGPTQAWMALTLRLFHLSGQWVRLDCFSSSKRAWARASSWSITTAKWPYHVGGDNSIVMFAC
jgi:hypothetical protein